MKSVIGPEYSFNRSRDELSSELLSEAAAINGAWDSFCDDPKQAASIRNDARLDLELDAHLALDRASSDITKYKGILRQLDGDLTDEELAPHIPKELGSKDLELASIIGDLLVSNL